MGHQVLIDNAYVVGSARFQRSRGVIRIIPHFIGHSADESGFFPVFIHLSVQRAGYRRNGNSACFSDIFQLYHIPNIPFR